MLGVRARFFPIKNFSFLRAEKIWVRGEEKRSGFLKENFRRVIFSFPYYFCPQTANF